MKKILIFAVLCAIVFAVEYARSAVAIVVHSNSSRIAIANNY